MERPIGALFTAVRVSLCSVVEKKELSKNGETLTLLVNL